MTPIVLYLDTLEGIAAFLLALIAFVYAILSAIDSLRCRR